VYQSDIPILISTDKAILLGLIINELITNSLKHAFNREVHNKIAISINKQDDKWMQVHYEDNGRGEIISTQSKKSFGIGMVQQLVKQLKGTITFEPSSPKKITISIPLS
jgi:two-component sensor histidine kinase